MFLFGGFTFSPEHRGLLKGELFRRGGWGYFSLTSSRLKFFSGWKKNQTFQCKNASMSFRRLSPEDELGYIRDQGALFSWGIYIFPGTVVHAGQQCNPEFSRKQLKLEFKNFQRTERLVSPLPCLTAKDSRRTPTARAFLKERDFLSRNAPLLAQPKVHMTSAGPILFRRNTS